MLAAILPLIGSIIDKILPDPTQAADAKLKALELAQKGELAVLDAEVKMALGQMEINKAEASTDMFRGGWRPLIGYVFGFALAFQYILNPVFLWTNAAFNLGVIPPDIKLDSMLWELMFGMLGMGGLRTFEKIKGRA